eukprot:755712-Rhodomonas_salina.3
MASPAHVTVTDEMGPPLIVILPYYVTSSLLRLAATTGRSRNTVSITTSSSTSLTRVSHTVTQGTDLAHTAGEYRVPLYPVPGGYERWEFYLRTKLDPEYPDYPNRNSYYK